ncbi:hypothetical protein [Caballeronia cordobensis]|uniref:hypothetical protein n=1 Tax=Caballeronia cordobensis TaxID=1353886 RepID=UPI00045F08BD|nr:uncharacterized protein BRPE67_BCDS11070 [Burkholderia sp. RPE67]
MNDMSEVPDAPAFHFDGENEIVKTRFMGTVTLRDVGYERVEAIIYMENRATVTDEDTRTMMDRVIRRLLIESAEGERGERLTNDLFAHLPGRLMFDMTALRKAVMRLYGLDQDDVKNE